MLTMCLAMSRFHDHICVLRPPRAQGIDWLKGSDQRKTCISFLSLAQRRDAGIPWGWRQHTFGMTQQLGQRGCGVEVQAEASEDDLGVEPMCEALVHIGEGPLLVTAARFSARKHSHSSISR